MISSAGRPLPVSPPPITPPPRPPSHTGYEQRGYDGQPLCRWLQHRARRPRWDPGNGSRGGGRENNALLGFCLDPSSLASNFFPVQNVPVPTLDVGELPLPPLPRPPITVGSPPPLRALLAVHALEGPRAPYGLSFLVSRLSFLNYLIVLQPRGSPDSSVLIYRPPGGAGIHNERALRDNIENIGKYTYRHLPNENHVLMGTREDLSAGDLFLLNLLCGGGGGISGPQCGASSAPSSTR